jgi:isopentenyl diphosphate isomerase/L-lactate dehydrogenase-like FMN-dependent dehydrogenase
VASDFITTTEIVAAARRNLGPEAWGRLDSGTETETTVARNRLGFDTLALRPRVLVDVSTIDMTATFLGERLRIPVLLAPIGSSAMFTPDGPYDIARAAETFGTLPILASVAKGSTWEEVAGATGGPKVLQLAFTGDVDSFRDTIARVREVGYRALCLAFDTPRFGRAEREMMATRNPIRPTGPLRTGMDWATLERIIEGAGLPLIAKGITHPDDARRLVELGFEVIYVGNHGGLNLDHMRGAVEALPEVVEAVGGRAEVILDGGVVRGTDVVKALALGASAVAIGRLQCFGLGADGPAGLVRILELLEEEILHAMTYLGAPTIADIRRDHVISGVLPVVRPSVFSAFPLLDS